MCFALALTLYFYTVIGLIDVYEIAPAWIVTWMRGNPAAVLWHPFQVAVLGLMWLLLRKPH